MPKQSNNKMVEMAYRRGAEDHQGGVDEGKLGVYMMEVFGILNNKKDKKKVPKCPGPMPWQGVVCEDNCDAIRLNNGLYTQCVLKKKIGNWCLACSKQSEKNASGVPDNGSIVDRLSKPKMEYMDPKGRKVVAYMTVLNKLKVTREMMDVYCIENKLALISDEYFELSEAVEDKEKVEKKVVEKKVVEKKGRPKKAKKEVTVSNVSTEDLFATLLQEQEQEKEQEKEQEQGRRIS